MNGDEAPTSDRLRVVERFMPVDCLHDPVRADDRRSATRGRGRGPSRTSLAADVGVRCRRYACHEGNYGLANILTSGPLGGEGGRGDDRQHNLADRARLYVLAYASTSCVAPRAVTASWYWVGCPPPPCENVRCPAQPNQDGGIPPHGSTVQRVHFSLRSVLSRCRGHPARRANQEARGKGGSGQESCRLDARIDRRRAGVFQKYCRFCHGTDAKGDGPQAPKDTHPPNLIDEKWDHGSTDAEIFATIKDGIGPKFDMKGFNSKMTPQEMWSVVNYLRSIGPQDAAD